MNRESGLKSFIENGELKITIGLDRLKEALEYGLRKGDPLKITNIDIFAEEVAKYADWEDESGENNIYKMLDKSALDAIEQGDCEGTNYWED